MFLHLRDPEQHGNPVDQFGDLKVTLNVSGDGLGEDDIDFIRRTVQRSAVFNLFTVPREAKVEVERVHAIGKAA